MEYFDVTTFIAGDEVHYYGHDESGKAIIDIGIVQGENYHKDGVQVYGEGWKQYIGKWFICKVVRNGEVIYQQEEDEE